MSQAITRCPECKTSFRVTEDQLLIADGSVRCGACLHLFQAEDYFVSPLLDETEKLAIEADYWADFDAYLLQVLPTGWLSIGNHCSPSSRFMLIFPGLKKTLKTSLKNSR